MNYPKTTLELQEEFLELYDIPDISLMECEYRDSFVFDEDFTGKRFQRYVNKIKNFIYDKYINIVYEDIANTLSSKNLVEFIIEFFQNYYLTDYEDDDMDGMLFDCFYEYCHPTEKDDLDEQSLFNYLLMPHMDAPLSFEDIINKEIEKVCKDYIRFRCIEMKEVDESNYFQTLPENPGYAMVLFDRIVNYIKIDIDNFCSQKRAKEMRKILKQKTVKTLADENNELSDRIEELEKEVVENKKTINILNSKLKHSSLPKKSNEIQLLSEQNEALVRQNDKLKEKYNQLLNKYEALKEKNKEKITEREKQEEELKELNKDGKYLFISYEDVTFKRAVLDEFPNSDFCDSNININASSVDLVVVLTEHINHSTYYAIKEQCKQKNIPLVHCRFSNLELIKELMWNTLNL